MSDRIEDPDQLAALASPLRQEICNTLAGLGEASTVELARQLGVPADALYYHVRKLVDTGLLVERGQRPTARRDEATYALGHRTMKLRYRPDDDDNAAHVRRIVAGALKAAAADFDNGYRPELAVTDGGQRNLWGARHRAWLTNDELREVNELLARLGEIFGAAGGAGEGTLCTLTWVLAPLEPRPLRREATGG
jgi:DNA-binding transcriptional ArsR family regulator